MTSPIIYICDHVFSGDRKIELIVHHNDGMWQLTCGREDHSIGGSSIRPVHIEHVVMEHYLAKAMMQTPQGHLSKLNMDGCWTGEPFDEE
jgi:hypothetical protein